MFGNSNNNGVQPTRLKAADLARLEAPLTQVIVTGPSSSDVYVFQNGAPLPAGDFDSLSIEIIAPNETGAGGSINGVLSLQQPGPGGTREARGISVFPGTLELLANGRRVIVTCVNPTSFEGLWLGLGLRADGTSRELTGVQSMQLVVSAGLLEAKIHWSEDNTTEDLIPSG